MEKFYKLDNYINLISYRINVKIVFRKKRKKNNFLYRFFNKIVKFYYGFLKFC